MIMKTMWMSIDAIASNQPYIKGATKEKTSSRLVWCIPSVPNHEAQLGLEWWVIKYCCQAAAVAYSHLDLRATNLKKSNSSSHVPLKSSGIHQQQNAIPVCRCPPPGCTASRHRKTVVQRARGGSLYRPSCCPCRPCRHRWLRCLPPPQPHHPPPARRPGRKALATKSRWPRHEVPPKFRATEIRKSRADQVLSAQGKPSYLFQTTELVAFCKSLRSGIKSGSKGCEAHQQSIQGTLLHRTKCAPNLLPFTFESLRSHSNPLTNWIYCNLQCYAPTWVPTWSSPCEAFANSRANRSIQLGNWSSTGQKKCSLAWLKFVMEILDLFLWKCF